MNLLQRFAAVVNTAVRPLVTSRPGELLTGRWMTVLGYTGRRSGKTFSLPVAYSRKGNVVTINVELPEQKNWWRNFLNEGWPVTARLDGADKPGHAVAHRDEDGNVTVSIQLDPDKSPAAELSFTGETAAGLPTDTIST